MLLGRGQYLQRTNSRGKLRLVPRKKESGCGWEGVVEGNRFGEGGRDHTGGAEP